MHGNISDHVDGELSGGSSASRNFLSLNIKLRRYTSSWFLSLKPGKLSHEVSPGVERFPVRSGEEGNRIDFEFYESHLEIEGLFWKMLPFHPNKKEQLFGLVKIQNLSLKEKVWTKAEHIQLKVSI